MPAGTTTSGRPVSAATAATADTVPSPPATPPTPGPHPGRRSSRATQPLVPRWSSRGSHVLGPLNQAVTSSLAATRAWVRHHHHPGTCPSASHHRTSRRLLRNRRETSCQPILPRTDAADRFPSIVTPPGSVSPGEDEGSQVGFTGADRDDAESHRIAHNASKTPPCARASFRPRTASAAASSLGQAHDANE